MEEGQAQEQPEDAVAALTGYLDAEEKREEEEKTEGATETEGTEEVQAEQKEEGGEKAIELDPEAPIFELTVKSEGGADVAKKVSLKELQAGYMMQADYQRKTAEVAKQRSELETQIKSKVDPVVQNYEKQLHVLGTVVSQLAAPELANVNWVELANSDPAKFVALKAKADQFNGIMNNIQQEQAKLLQQRTQEQQTARDKAAQEAVEKLKSDPVLKIDGWNNDKYQSILKSAIEQYGFKPEEVTTVVDARIIKVLNDALAYRELKSAKPIADKKVVSLPKVVKPGTSDKDDPIADRKKAALTKLRKSGHVDDAAAAIFDMI